MSDKQKIPKIFHLITRLTNGGAVNTLTNIVTNIEGYDIVVGYGSEYDSECISKLENSGIETVQFPLMRHYNPITSVGAVVSISKYIKKQNFDIVHTHSTEAGIIGRTSANLVGIPNIIHTIHGVPFTDDRNKLLNKFVEICEMKVAPWTTVLVSIADVISEEYLSRGIGSLDQYQTIYCGINVDQFRNAEALDNLPGDGIRILMVGRLAEGKGFDVLLDAAESIDYPDLSIIIVGDGPLRNHLESEIIDRGLIDNVFLLGYREDIPSIMAASDIFVLPSYREGTPLVIYEAMAAGLPVIATNIAGIPEQIIDDQSGYLIPTGNSKELCSAIDLLVKKRQKRRSFGRNNQIRVDRFSVENMVQEYQGLYDGMIEK